jgi:hypothetical protein
MTKTLITSLLIIVSTSVWEQSDSKESKNTCGWDAEVIFPLNLDPVRRQVIVDSVNQLLIGRWQLIDVSDQVFVSMPTPEQHIEILIDKQGQTMVYRQGKPILNCRLAASLAFYRLRCEADQAARTYFHLREPVLSEGKYDTPKGQYVHSNRLRICRDTLVFYALTSAGPSYTFKRLTSIQTSN